MTPNSSPSSQVRRITAEDRPVFPCEILHEKAGWITFECEGLRNDDWQDYGWTHWRPISSDHPAAPTINALLDTKHAAAPAASAPELPPSLVQAVELYVTGTKRELDPWEKDEANDILTALRPLWPATAKLEKPMCSCCAGRGVALSGPCICGGSGTQDDECQGLREALHKELSSSAPDLTGAAKAEQATITVTRQQLIETTRVMAGAVSSLMYPDPKNIEAIEKLGADVFDGIAAVPFTAPAAVGEGARRELLAVFAKHIRSYEESHGYMSEKELAETLVDALAPRPSAERTDGERLDWIEQSDWREWLNVDEDGYIELKKPNKLRAAIDSAMSQSPARKGQGGSK